MNSIGSYLLEVALTLAMCLAIVRYLRPFLKKILVDLCGTEDRAHFWTAFSNTLLLGLPMVMAVAYTPEAKDAESLFFEVTRKLSGNLSSFLVGLVGAGLMISLFALFAPKTPKTESK